MGILLYLFGIIIIILKFILDLYYFPIKKIGNILKVNKFFENPKNIIELILKFIVNLLLTTYSFFIYVYFIIRNYDSYTFLSI